uniref:TIGR04219 family outer membrane beta-barrel protein n=1 Tax=Marinobacterium profundum TaxID=1714300 RepID=UPI000836E6E4|nr:TIGR04219 family outer membrane beta-barrel protein [Marinobacterium profundum]
MKGRKTLAAAALLAVAAIPVQADTVLGVRAGTQVWNMDGESILGSANQSSRADFDFNREQQNSYHVSLEHPVPLLPNIKLKRTELASKGQAEVSGFNFEGTNFNGNVDTDVDFGHNDLTLYYELLDNWVSLDLGVTVMQMDGHVEVSQGSQTERVDFDGYVPTLYVAAEFELPLTGLSLGAEANGLAAGEHHFYDAQAQLQYKLIDNLAVDVALQVGYRQSALKLDDIDNLDTDLEFSGAFAGVQVHF